MAVIFRYKNGRIIPIKVDEEQTTNEYMNNKIRGKKEYKIPKNILEDAYNLNKEMYNPNIYGNNATSLYVTDIAPDDFIKLTTTEDYISTLKETNYVLGRNKLDLDKINSSYMFLTVDLETGQVTGHEGRHRMLLLKNAGYKKAQIIIRADNQNTSKHIYSPQTYKYKKLKNQVNKKDTVVIEKIMPITEAIKKE